ncbi:MAG: non-homologous end-joining DNA ligase [Planctomycetota bacterium]
MPKKSLDEYHKKRDFSQTTEPTGDGDAGDPNAHTFVIHRHEATHLHYDLRLRMQGTLKSWAVPRGFSYNPKEKRLAMRTEDHPLLYETFSGVIPKGQYGAGTMEIWDAGRYELVNADGEAGLEGGKLEVVLFGQRLRGEWHMVKTTKEENGWLLFKGRSDVYARGEDDPPYPFALDLAAAEAAAPPAAGLPMRASAEVAAFSDPDWLFEMEFAGCRAFAIRDAEKITYRVGKKKLPVPAAESLEAELLRLRGEDVVLDGVLVVLDDNGRPSAELAAERLAGHNERPLHYYAFDVLYYDEWRLAKLPLRDRKTLLATLIPESPHLLYVDHVVGEGEQLAEVVVGAGLPGVIAKDGSSPYRAGKSPRWRRIAAGHDSGADGDVLEKISASAPSARKTKVKFTNREKVYFPDLGYTKGDLIDYYAAIAEVALPYMHNRPLHMFRFPDGIDGKSFYNHNAPDHTPDWVLTETMGDTRYVICNDRDTLLYLANLGSIDIHPWMSQLGSLDTPDWHVLDLDPDGSPFPQVVRVARAIGKLLRGIGLQAWLKTSGKSGLHIVIPLIPHYTYEQGRMFGEGIARYVCREHPDIATVERSVSQRGGRVYIDFMQNHKGQTVVPPYVVRPTPAASVSTPLDWDELTPSLDPADFNISNVPERVAQLGDLFRGTLTEPQDLIPAIEIFQREYMGL